MEIYDALIDGIPEDLIVDELITGTKLPMCAAETERNSLLEGLSDQNAHVYQKPDWSPLREVAGAVKSWNFVEASAGLAAINAYYNNPETARANGVNFSDARRVEDRMNDPFIMYQNEIKGKRVAVIGHFPYLESLFEPICDLSIISWNPQEGDYPLPACEYILPECHYVFIYSSCITDKTMPRMLELAKRARVTVVGPSTPLAPVLFDYGISELSGFIIKDNALARRITAGAEKVKIYSSGQKVSFKKSR